MLITFCCIFYDDKRLLESTVSVLPTNSHSSLALLCHIGKIEHPSFENRTMALLKRIATSIKECSTTSERYSSFGTSSLCMDVGEPRVTWRLATLLRLASFREESALLLEREEALLSDMRTWKSTGGLSSIELLSPRANLEATAELVTGRCLARLEIEPFLAKQQELATEVFQALSIFPMQSLATAKHVWDQADSMEAFMNLGARNVLGPRWNQIRTFLGNEC
jgi:hypothetical protein